MIEIKKLEGLHYFYHKESKTWRYFPTPVSDFIDSLVKENNELLDSLKDISSNLAKGQNLGVLQETVLRAIKKQ